jgi:hypothetical protein
MRVQIFRRARICLACTKKTRFPLCGVVLRLAVASHDADRARRLAKATETFFLQYTRRDGNSFIPLENDQYEDSLHEEALLLRQSYRVGMLLSMEEVAGLVHLPDASVRHPGFAREQIRTKAVPTVARGHELVLGENEHQGIRQPVTLARESRLEHMHVIGGSGTGKSTFLLNLILQDIHHGEGLALLEPHGDLIDEVLARIPDERRSDVILFDPSDEGGRRFQPPFGQSEVEKTFSPRILSGCSSAPRPPGATP